MTTLDGATALAHETLLNLTPATFRRTNIDKHHVSATWLIPFGAGARVDAGISFIPHLASSGPTLCTPRVTVSMALAEEASDALAAVAFAQQIIQGVQQVERALNARGMRIEA